MAANESKVRTSLLASIGVVWLAAIVVVVAITLNSPGSKRGTLSPDDQATQDRRYEACVAALSNPDSLRGQHLCYQENRIDPGQEADYDARSAVIQVGVVTLVALVLVAVSLVWTRPRPAQRQYAARDSPLSVGDSVPPASQRSSPVAKSLRELKSLHDEGILTDDEYAAKRQGLADQL